MSDTLKIEELLKPRYKVIADYPGSSFQVGQVLTQKTVGGHYFANDDLMIREKYVIKYPHLFKKLEWWEERKESDMPEYVKVNTEKTSLFIGDVHKVRELHLFPDPKTLNIDASKHYVLLEEKDNFYRFYLSHFLPATKEEFDKQNISVKKAE